MKLGLRDYRAAIISALFFACMPPGVKLLEKFLPPQSLAGIIYLFAGLGLFVVLIFTKKMFIAFSHFKRQDVKWLVFVIFFGGVLAPAFFVYGARQMSSSMSSLLLNLEVVFTALLAWFIFKEHFIWRIFWGISLIVFGCVVLVFHSEIFGENNSFWGVILVGLSCLAWALDNNFTRQISHLNPLLIAAIKGLLAGTANLSIGLFLGEQFQVGVAFWGAGFLGILVVGVSLTAFVISLGKIGTARTGAILASPSFIGAFLSLVFLREELSFQLLLSMILIASGVWLHLSEEHDHEHTHEMLEHAHLHLSDEHHQHKHEGMGELAEEPHDHWHYHEKLTHRHSHFPDIHHRHLHE